MWAFIYHILRFLSPFWKLISYLLTAFILLGVIGFLIQGNYFNAFFAVVIMFLLYLSRRYYEAVLLHAARKAQVTA